jgi:hypothetical protein
MTPSDLLEKAVNGIVRLVKLISRMEHAPATASKSERDSRDMLDETMSYHSVKVITRSDGQERVRIVQKAKNFGAVVDFDDPKCGWSPEHVIGMGITYESPAVAEAEAESILAWLKDPKERASQPPEPAPAPRSSS